MLESNPVKIHFEYRNKSQKTSEAIWEAFSDKVCQKPAFWRTDFQEKIKSKERSRNMKITHHFRERKHNDWV